MSKRDSDIGGAYYILNTRNNKMYVGQSWQLNERFRQHLHSLQTSKHQIPALQEDWNTFGGTAFEFGILVEMSKQDQQGYHHLNDIEKIFIHTYQSDNPTLGYNTNASQKSLKSRARIKRMRDEANDAARKYRP